MTNNTTNNDSNSNSNNSTSSSGGGSSYYENTLKTQLSEGRATFSFTKSDGTVRQANGTTNVDLIPESSRQSASTLNSNPNSNTVQYWDFDANDFRQFNPNNVINPDKQGEPA